MQAQIRMGESGHSYHYPALTTVHALMQQIKKDFKIQLEDQKIILKSGQLLKSTMNFSSFQQSMRKTITTNNSTSLNPSLLTSQVKQIDCLYVYNQKQLLKPIEHKPFNEQYHLKIHRQKFKERSLLAQNSYELKQFIEKTSEKNVLSIVESITKRFKIPFDNLTYRYTRFHDHLQQRNYYKMQITSLLDLIQNQDKARKLLIKNVQWTHDKRTKRKLLNIKQKLNKQTQLQYQQNMKENSHLLSSQKDNFYSESLKQFLQLFTELQNKNNIFFEKLKNSKREVTKKKFQAEEKTTFRIDKKITTNEKQFQKTIKDVKSYFEQFCQEIIKVNIIFSKNKETKESIKELLLINQKILNFEKLLEESVKEFTQMYLELTKIHVKSQTQNIKIVFGIYVELIKNYQELENQVRKFEKQFTSYTQQKSNRQIKVSEFNEKKSSDLPLKKSIKSPKKEDIQKKNQRQESSVTRQLQSNMPKINSPIKSKICKNSLKSFNDEVNSKIFQNAFKQSKQLQRRFEFNRRLESLVKYCTNLCEREQSLRKSFRNSKEFEDNKIDLLNVLSVPTVDIDYSLTSDAELIQNYKKLLKQNTLKYQIQVNWEFQVIDSLNIISNQLNNFLLENANNPTEREKSMQKIVSVMSVTFYKMMKVKMEKQLQNMKKSISKHGKNEDKELIESLMRSNDDLQQQISQLQIQVKRLSQENRLSLQSLEESITPQTHQFFSEKYRELMSNFRALEEQNQVIRNHKKQLQGRLLAFQQEVNQTTQKLIESYQQANASELQKLNTQLKAQKQLSAKLQFELDIGKRNLMKQMGSIQNLFQKIRQLTEEKDFYERQFAQLKGLLADKQVAIIKLQKQIEGLIKQLQTQKNQTKRIKNQFEKSGQSITDQKQHECEYSEEVISLRQKNQELQIEIENLDKELKEILFKETIDQQIQTQAQEQVFSEEEYRIKKGKEDMFIASSLQQNRQTSKLVSQQKSVNPNPNSIMNELATKQAHLNNFHVSIDQNFNIQNQAAVSQYYISSMGQQWLTSVFNKFTHLVIGKTLEQGMIHIFLPFSNDIYIGVTVNDNSKNFTNYRQYLNNESQRIAERIPSDPIYVLDLKEFNLKTNEMLRQCSLVLAVKIQRKGKVSMGNKIMVSGKIQFALGFEDDDMVIKNYSHFLQE